MHSYRAAALVAAFGLFAFGSAIAAPIVPTFNNDRGPDLYDAVNVLTGSSHNGNDDIHGLKVADLDDLAFTLLGNQIPVIGFSASFKNLLGYYNDLGTGAVQFDASAAKSGFGFTGSGTAADPFDGVTLSPDPTGTKIGFFLTSSGGGGTQFFSEPGLNADGIDHLIAYALGAPLSVFTDFGGAIGVVEISFANPILLGWEDITGGGDMDFDDLIYLIDARPTPVPLPASALLLMAALGGLGLLRALKGRASRSV